MSLQVSLQSSNELAGHTPTIQIPLWIIRQLNIPIKKTIQIRAGNKCILANLLLLEEEKNKNLIMNQKLYQQLSLPSITFEITANYQNHALWIGPFIAVLTEIKSSKNESPIFGSIHEFCKELHHYSQQTGAVVYITSFTKYPHKGYYLMDSGWVEASIPYPDFIYNRIHSRITEKGKLFKQTALEWGKNKSILFNSCFLSKWVVHEKFKKSNQLQSFLPKTYLYDKENFPEWLYQYKDLFIKPVNGSQGRGIIHVFQNNNEIMIERTSLSLPNKLRYQSAVQAASDIRKWINKKAFIIQETLPLITIENKKIDFRFLCHKINNFEWKITSAVGRISADDQFVSNIAQGGTLSRPMEILNNHFTKEKATLTNQLMKDLALEVSRVVDQSFDGLFVELGIDIGVDITGKPWLIEVNSKPSKQMDTVKNLIRPSAKAIINYCNNNWKERSHNDDNVGDFNAPST